jgi:NADH dehydrogenase
MVEYEDFCYWRRVCWCSGVKALLRPSGNYEALPDGRIMVNEYLNLSNYPEVYIAGDATAIKDIKGNILILITSLKN